MLLTLVTIASGCKTANEQANATLSLFDGKSLTGWTITEFAGRGEVKVQTNQLFLEMGVALTGVTYTNTAVLPKVNYEIYLEGQKVAGNDFFCALTFPYKDSHATLVLGGWGGAVVGISSVNGSDASDNETTKYLFLEKGRWFKVLLRVTDNKIQAWLDEEQIVDLDTEDKTISMRPGEIEMNAPLGIATWQTTGAFREIKLRKIPAATK